jgi:pimeloyl-ACP methyl ester carboxylesterase
MILNRILTKWLTTITLGLLCASACSSQSSSWHDPSNHRVRFVTVENGVRLEVLDWGGSGRNVILLAGSGNTAHVYDDFAPKLVGFCHVYGITRRGFGVSSHPKTGYSEQRLADDVVQVIDSLKIASPVLIGHSMAGGEITLVARQHPDRLLGLVYLEAVRDPTRDYSQISKELQAAHLHPVTPSEPKDKSFAAFREWQLQRDGFAFPESELRNSYLTNPDGTMGKFGTSDAVFDALGDSAQKRNYSSVHVPILAIVSLPESSAQIISRNYQFNETDQRAPVEDAYTKVVDYIRVDEKSVQNARAPVRIVELPGSDHYVYLATPDAVLREVQAFLKGLPSSANTK